MTSYHCTNGTTFNMKYVNSNSSLNQRRLHKRFSVYSSSLHCASDDLALIICYDDMILLSLQLQV